MKLLCQYFNMIFLVYKQNLVYYILSTCEIWRVLFLAGWQEYLKEGVCNLSIDEAVQVGTCRN